MTHEATLGSIRPGAAPDTSDGDRPRALVVEDEPDVARVLCLAASHCGYATVVAPDAETALEMTSRSCPALVLLDLCLPGKRGESVLTHLREIHADSAVIVVSGIVDLPTRADLLNMGADDYVTKPFELLDLQARIVAVSRRSCPRLCFRHFATGLRLEPGRSIAKWGHTEIPLTVREFGVLWVLACHHPHVTPIAFVCRSVIGHSSQRTIDDCRAHISRLRAKFKRHRVPIRIGCAIGEGYFVLPDRD